MRPYEFSNDWFGAAQAPSVWPRFAQHLPGNTAFLEIGSWEGRSTVWTAENLAAPRGAQIVCVDSWQGGEEHDPRQMGGVHARFQANMAALAANRREAGGDIAVRALRGASVQGLAQLLVEERRFDFCYVDGSHTARDTLTDACMAWAMLKDGGPAPTGRFAGLALLETVRDYPARHASSMIPLEAAAAAARSARDRTRLAGAA